MSKKTKADIEKEMKTAIAERDTALAQYDELLSQARAVQAQSAQRLMFLRLFETFANEVNSSVQKLQSDIMEITTQQNQEQDETGEEL